MLPPLPMLTEPALSPISADARKPCETGRTWRGVARRTSTESSNSGMVIIGMGRGDTQRKDRPDAHRGMWQGAVLRLRALR